MVMVMMVVVMVMVVLTMTGDTWLRIRNSELLFVAMSSRTRQKCLQMTLIVMITPQDADEEF